MTDECVGCGIYTKVCPADTCLMAWYLLGDGDKALIQEPVLIELAKSMERVMSNLFYADIYRIKCR